ncbi:MAG TPA: sodium:proton antiporter [Candidatus Polarisedimenticolia bacterium]|nr:sodium:proton antiporter [Candidatus Polarisedimenticolia bacterium]
MPETTAAFPLVSVLPFAGLLLSIALLPARAPHFWHRHYHHVALGWGAVFALPYLVLHPGAAIHDLLHALLTEYLPFVVLLGALFVISGGIVVRGRLGGTPLHNTLLLAFGTAIASLIGTTGAAMVLVRPLLRANAGRASRAHVVVFFIFLVANIGGCLTPLGDPPLFLGFLEGVPFFWTLRLLPHLLVAAATLLAIFFVLDTVVARREAGLPRRAPWAADPSAPAAPADARPGLDGAGNLVLLALLLGMVLLSGVWHPGRVDLPGVALPLEGLVRDGALIILATLSLRLTPGRLRLANAFTWEPIREVAWLFAGIFVTIIPAIAILRSGGGPASSLLQGLTEPRHLYWATGLLSSVLDNAPTYLTFVNALIGRLGPGLDPASGMARLTTDGAVLLEAVSAGAVFMGAMTYIGNAPNLMVRAIAEEAGVTMPSFGRFVLRYAVPFLLPALLLVHLVCF